MIELYKELKDIFKLGLEDNIASKGQGTWGDSTAALRRRVKGIVRFLPNSSLNTAMTLVDTGKMVQVLDYKITKDGLTIRTKMPYAAYVQLGTASMVARKWFYVSEATETKMHRTIVSYVDKMIEEELQDE